MAQLKWEYNHGLNLWEGRNSWGQLVYVVGYEERYGWGWLLCWRYKTHKTNFTSREDAIASAEEDYQLLRERTATGCRKKYYNI